MANQDYQPPVNKLLTYGESAARSKEWPNYVQDLGLQKTHIPELIRMVTDEVFNQADSESLEVWAPTHAWRALGQLQAKSATASLLALLDNSFDDWAHTEIPTVLSLIGPEVIPDIERYLADPKRDHYGRITAVTCLRQLQERHLQARERCIEILLEQLALFEENEPDLNGFLIAGLCDLEAVEHASEIERAFAAKRVDLSIMGDWDEAQVQLGLKTRQEVPLRGFTPTKVLGPLSPEVVALLNKDLDALPPLGTSKQRPQPQGFGTHTKQKKDKKTRKKRR
ncbi:MAG: DUF1186 domain-containing protein [Cyanobacteria bacterium P01_G01_bin.54]